MIIWTIGKIQNKGNWYVIRKNKKKLGTYNANSGK